MDLFVPVEEEYKDLGLAERWENILRVRKEVTKTIEIARREKRIGHSLETAVTLGLPENLSAQLAPYRDQLKSIFIVSAVHLASTEEIVNGYESDEVKGLRVQVEPSTDPKCERCWVQDPSVGEHKGYPTICNRCVSSLNEMEIRKK
jgi:isoleucyl-tRNA synthetase